MSIHIVRSAPTVLVASTVRTQVMVIAGAAKRLKVKEWGISFNDTDASHAPILVELYRATTAGTNAAAVVAVNDPGEDAMVATGFQTFSGTEPTGTEAFFTGYVTPAGGLFVMQYPLGDEPKLAVSTRVAIRVTPGASTTCNAVGYIKFEE